MQLNENTKKANLILTQWASGDQEYSLYNHKDMEVHGSFEEWFEENFQL